MEDCTSCLSMAICLLCKFSAQLYIQIVCTGVKSWFASTEACQSNLIFLLIPFVDKGEAAVIHLDFSFLVWNYWWELDANLAT